MAEVDLFSPFRRRAEAHEDRLTWGLLVALKYAPDLQQLLRELVIQRLPPGTWPFRGGWEPAAVHTQTARIGGGASFVVSVLVSDASIPSLPEVEKSERAARYDGVIEYADGLVLILENKPYSGDVWVGQLSPSQASFEGLDDTVLFEQPVSLEWAEVLEGVLTYAGSQVAPYAGRGLAGDFLSYVEDLYPELSPYRTFALCGARPEALERRNGTLLETLAERLRGEVRTRPGGRRYVHIENGVVQQIHFAVRELDQGLGFDLGIWPGDTVAQARALLECLDKEAFLALPETGWRVEANLHFSHMQKHLVWATPRLDVPEYLDYFASHPEEVGQKRFIDIDLPKLIENWSELGLLSGPDVTDLRREFGETQRSFLNVIPGFQLTRQWSLEEIVELEEDGSLEAVVLSALRTPFATWGDTLSVEAEDVRTLAEP